MSMKVNGTEVSREVAGEVARTVEASHAGAPGGGR
jgi:hypothetical protein